MIAGADGFGHGVLDPSLDPFVLAEPDRELEVDESKLARCRRIEIGACLEVVGRDGELRGEPPQRLHRGLAGAGLDPRDVCVRDARGSELTLRKAPLQPQALESLPDHLARGWRNIGFHLRDILNGLPGVRQTLPRDNGRRAVAPGTDRSAVPSPRDGPRALP